MSSGAESGKHRVNGMLKFNHKKFLQQHSFITIKRLNESVYGLWIKPSEDTILFIIITYNGIKIINWEPFTLSLFNKNSYIENQPLQK